VSPRQKLLLKEVVIVFHEHRHASPLSVKAVRDHIQKRHIEKVWRWEIDTVMKALLQRGRLTRTGGTGKSGSPYVYRSRSNGL